MPLLDGVRHRFIDVGDGQSIHIAEAGPADGPPVMLVHGFPQNWWEWRDIVGPLAADGYHVICPDLPGAGWSSAPERRYRKAEMADALAAMIDRIGVGPVTVVAHDWGGPVSFIMMLNHPDKVTGFFGVNTVAPWLRTDPATLRHLWRFWYQIPLALPVVGPKLIADPRGRFFGIINRWVSGGYVMPEQDFWLYVRRLGEPGHAVAGSRWYRTFITRELLPWARGEYADAHVSVPVRWLHGTADPVLTPTLLRTYAEHIDDFDVELIDGVGHWSPEQRPNLVLHRLQAFLGSNRKPTSCSQTAGKKPASRPPISRTGR
jgi:pimeloyl-ACP methyl ester carboxylesterase